MIVRILLTGATGFIGRGLVPMLRNSGYDPVLLLRADSSLVTDCELAKCSTIRVESNVESLAEQLRQSGCVAVLHLASLFLATHQPSQVSELIESNIAFPTRLLEAMKLAGIKQIVNTGTFFQNSDGKTGSPFNLYAASKQAFQDIVDHYVRNEGFRAITLKLADTYGSGDTRRKLVQLLLDAACRGEHLGLSPGEQKISLTWVDDVRSAFVVALKRLEEQTDGSHFVYGACHPHLRSVKEIAATVATVTNTNPDFAWGERPYRPNEIMNPVLPEQLPGWQPSIDLTMGLAKLLQVAKCPSENR